MFKGSNSAPMQRMVLVKSFKSVVGKIAVYVNTSGHRCPIYWVQDKERRDVNKPRYQPEPLSPYWAKMHDDIFKKWRD